MPLIPDPTVISGLLDFAHELDRKGGWQPFRTGVTAHWIYNEGGEGPRAVLLRFEPGARVGLHEHLGYEHMLVLEGDQFDENGSYPAGSFVVHPPGSRHTPGSRQGCVALLIYEKFVRFVDTGA